MNKVVLIERDLSDASQWMMWEGKTQEQKQALRPMLSQYKGFEGDLVEVSLLKNEHKLPSVVQGLVKLKDLGSCFLLFLTSYTSVPIYVKTKGKKLGYDVGGCADETYDMFSSIYHEIIFGRVEELFRFKSQLNENLLFKDRVTAEGYVKVHGEMAALGKDVEDYMPFIIYEVWDIGG